MDPIVAVICTRNRGSQIRRAVDSVLANDHDSFRLIVVDQSTDDVTEAALRDLDGSRVSYVRSREVGVSRARNLALRLADTEIVAYTDDDCEVPKSWLAAWHTLFREHPRVAVAFCSVLAGPFDDSRGFVPAYACRGTQVVSTTIGKCTARGMGAGLAVRRELMLNTLGGFDEMLGPGSTFPSCEEGDAAVRALLAGYEICESDRTHVIHHGFRSWQEGRELSRRDWFGIGAAYAKPLRAGRWDFAPVPLYEFFVKAMGAPLADIASLRKPRGIARTFHFLNGFARGLVAPFDRRRLLFTTPSAGSRSG